MTGDPILSTSPAWLLAYDISDPRRWRRTYRLARQEGIPLQKSLFLIPGDDLPTGFADAIQEIIHPKEDDVRAYHLPVGTRIWPLQQEVEGVVLGGLPW